MPQFYMIDIYNVSIIIKAETESEKYYMDIFRKEIETKLVTVESICKWCILHHIQYIHNWCRMHFVKYHTIFVYRKEYPVKANIWNGYSYIRWRMERMMNLG